MPLPPGQDSAGLVSGYELTDAIGKGGFARVYRARQISLDREVAIKIDSRILDDPRNRRRFLREATASALISSHPHVVSLIDAGTTSDNRPYLVMELCENGSLAQLIKRTGAMAPADVLELGVAVASALAAAHDRGILHRDIKPANILIDSFGAPRLGDFGLAALAAPGEEMSVTLEALTPAYAAPEAFEQATPSKQADVWALGATLYSMLTGQSPRQSEDGSPMSVAEIIESLNRPLQPAQVPGAAPLMEVIWQATSTDPSNRFADAGELRAALRGLTGRLGAPVRVQTDAEVTRLLALRGASVQPPLPSPAPGAGPLTEPPTSVRQAPAAHAVASPPLSPSSQPSVRASAFTPSAPTPKSAEAQARPQDTGPVVRPRRMWPVVVTSAVAVALLGGLWMASQSLTGQPQDNSISQAPKAVKTAPASHSSAKAGKKLAFPAPKVGTCYMGLTTIGSDTTADNVPCSASHWYEAFAVGELGEGVDLSQAFNDPAVKALCTTEKLSQYTGKSTAGLEIDVLPPSQSKYKAGYRYFSCIASSETLLEGSIRKR